MSKLGLIKVIILLILFNVSSLYSKDLSKFRKIKINVNGREMVVFVAKTDEEREKGLSNVDLSTLERTGAQGMLFIFDKPGEKTFQAWYMKFDLMLLVLERKGESEYYVKERKPLRIGTVEKVDGRYILEIPLKNSLTGSR
ncbi:MAG: DUF192 domain-containing protein [Proteobacteria bacterium]|nr:DUF192 domain-containing protein [Pseudomonadota bacterium]